MKRLILLLSIIGLSFMLTSCSTIYEGFTSIRIKAKSFTARCGPLNAFSGENVDAMFVRDMSLTSDKKRKLKKHPTIKVENEGDNTKFEVTKDED